MCMASPRGTVSCNAGLLGRTRERALPASDSPEGEGVLRFWRDDAAWPARPYTAPGLLWWVRKLGSLWADPAREKAGEELG